MLGYVIFLLSLFYINSIVPNKNIRLFLLFFVVFIFSAIRYGIGYDYYSYYAVVNQDSFLLLSWQPIPMILGKLSAYTNTYYFFFLTSLFICIFLYLSFKYSKVIEYKWESLLVYISFPLFYMFNMSTIRQAMAYSIVFAAYTVFYNNNLKKTILCIVAVLCHLSAIGAFIILIPFEKIKTRYLLILFIISFVSGEAFVNIVGSYASYFSVGDKFSQYAEISSLEVADGRSIRYVIYFVNLVSLYYRRTLNKNCERDRILKYLIGILCVGASFFALFSTVNMTLAKRYCTFFFMASIVVIPYVWYYFKLKKRLFNTMNLLLFAVTIYLQAGNFSRAEDIKRETSPTYPYRSMLFRFNEGFH